MALSTQHKVLIASQTAVGRNYFSLPDVPTVVALFVDILSGTATIDIEISDDNPKIDLAPVFIPVQTVSATTLAIISIPAAVIATNVTAITGEVKVSYRMTVGDSYLAVPLRLFSSSQLTPTDLNVSGSLTTSGPGTTTRLYGPAHPPTTATTIYLSPPATTTTVNMIHAVNTTGSAATITMSIGTNATATHILSAESIAANTHLTLTNDFIINAGDSLQALQGTTDAITLTVQGNAI